MAQWDGNEIGFGVIGCGLMGREFASAAARWCHLRDLDFLPRIAAVCDTNPQATAWFEHNVPGVRATDAFGPNGEIQLGIDLVEFVVAAGRLVLGIGEIPEPPGPRDDGPGSTLAMAATVLDLGRLVMRGQMGVDAANL